METPFEESRTPLGLETQRQWADWASARPTPCLFGLSAVVALLANALQPDGKVPVPRPAWYAKSHATFADVLAAVRQHIWGTFCDSTAAPAPALVRIPRSDRLRLAQAVCSAQ
jgi:hypothetical protein